MTDLEAARERAQKVIRTFPSRPGCICARCEDIQRPTVVEILEAQREEVARCVGLFPPNSKAWLAIRLRERVAELDKQIEEARR